MISKITLSKKIATFLICFFVAGLSFAQEPNAPTGLTTSNTGNPNEFMLTWDNDPVATGGFNIFIVGSMGDIFITTVAAGTTSYVYTGTYTNSGNGDSVTITDGNSYIAKIQALPDANFNAYSQESATVNAVAPQDPEAPTGLAFTDGNPNEFTLTWDADANATQGYNIFIVGSLGDIYITTVPAGSTSYVYTGTYTNSSNGDSVTITDGNTYTPKIQALPDSDFNAYSDTSVTVNATAPIDPVSPTNLATSSANPNEFTLTWDDDANATQGFNIFIVGTMGDIFITTVVAGSTSYTYTGTYTNPSNGDSVTIMDGGTFTAKIQALPDADFNAYSDATTGVLSTNNFNDVQFTMYSKSINK